ncbi:MAG: hypothetical protein A3H73_00860 [Candidatus Taylorbacteria bacterium RIFCSPLOWO2_02_FULL_50_120]|nr:MAG: hypothetical protein A2759_01370 [Candidatus Taylorbacteria bacterium RIFCSPHIGHO2_01_FULL_49_60]OHA40300.1 MAG: hypothetical protein A3H73_00860 [Candidatus Taylorbacteria bacterium RIFCSPLOWO2_02_FULL_50_120]
MIVAFGIFSVIMAVSVGSLASLLEANHKARALKTVVNNLHFAFENISRNVRTGSLYHCDITEGELTKTRDCANNPASSIIFTARNGKRIVYKYIPVGNGFGTLGRAIILPGQEGLLIDPAVFVPVTSPELRVEQLSFFVDGTSLSDKEQPRILIIMRGSMQGKSKVVSRFNFQTLVSQRLLDVEN